jgi:hypothetical protein
MIWITDHSEKVAKGAKGDLLKKKKKKKKGGIKKKKGGISKYQTPTKPTRPDPTRPLTL